MISDLLFRLRALFRRKTVEAELDDELRAHFERQVEKYVQSGLTREEALRRTRLEFGGLDQVKEECRDARGVALIETLLQDIRFAVRLLRKTPVVSTLALLSLALGIGANTAIFSLIDSVMLRMLPVQNPQELVQLKFRSPGMSDTFVNGVRVETSRRVYTNPMWEQVRDHQDVFSGAFAWSPTGFDLANGGPEQDIDGMYASGSYFSTLGVRPAIGRLLGATDDVRGCGGAAVLSYGFWQQHYGGAARAVGSTLRLDGHPFPVVGVTQAGFNGTDVGERFEVAIPICAQAIIAGKASFLDHRSAWWLMIMGRLKPGISSEQATARLNALAPDIFGASVPLNWPPAGQERFRKNTFVTVPAATGVTGFGAQLREQYERPLEILMVVVGLVLLIACANVASLMLARSAARQKELALRLSLGASRRRLIQQVLTESMVLSGAGALLGALFAPWAGPALVRLVSRKAGTVFLDLSINGHVLAFTIAIALLTGLIFSIPPALGARRASLISAIKEGAAVSGGHRSGFRAGRWIVATQFALSLVLLVGTGLFVRTFRNLLALNPGFDRHNVLLTSVRIHNAAIPEAARLGFYTEVLARLKAIPGAESVSQIWFTPFSGAAWNDDIKIDGYQPPPSQEPLVWLNFITPDHFATVRTPMLAGRKFDSRDTPTSAPVAIVNETFVHRFFPKAMPVGKYFRIPDSDNPTSTRPLQIVGVVKDSKYESLRETDLPLAYVPLAQMKTIPEESSFEIRSTISPAALIPEVRDAIGGINKSASLDFSTLAQQVDESLVQERLLALLSGFFGGLALLLTAIGLYGVMAYIVTQRTHEIGIRVALGARQGSILRLVMRDVAILLVSGIAAGTLGAVWVTRFVQHLLYRLTADDVGTLILAAGVLSGVALLASYIPARRAMRVDPMIALRYE
ncbi:MAG TPA: ABC transporter permease [Terriglobia bacterium]|nr:ABC transporter permease [Terriglobia bacterium]